MSINHTRYKNSFLKNAPNLKDAYAKDVEHAYNMMRVAQRATSPVYTHVNNLQSSDTDDTFAKTMDEIKEAKQSLKTALDAVIQLIPYIYNPDLVDSILQKTKKIHDIMGALAEMLRPTNRAQGVLNQEVLFNAIQMAFNAKIQSGETVKLCHTLMIDETKDIEGMKQMSSEQKVQLKRERMKEMRIKEREMPNKIKIESGVTNAIEKITDVKKRIKATTDQLDKIKTNVYNPQAETELEGAIHNTTEASWDLLLTMNGTYPKGPNAPHTRERDADAELKKMYTLLSDASASFTDTFKGNYLPHIKESKKKTLHGTLIQAESKVDEAKTMLSARGGRRNKTRRNKKSRRSRSRRSRRH